MSERDEIRRLQSVRDQLDQSCVISFAGAKYAIDDALKCMREQEARADLADERDRELVEALRWYQENARLCRLIHREGDEGRAALAADGGERAIKALAAYDERKEQADE